MSKHDEIAAADWENRFAAIEKEADSILATEGAHHCNKIYFVEAGDAYMARMIEAEQRVAKGEATTHVLWTDRAAQ
jgi:mannose-6-phosphate isomerase-like protein (cupin superfamily)